MNIQNIGSNMTLIRNNGIEILYSYNTSVAGFKPVTGWFFTNVKYSVTTTKHINKYLNGVGDAKKVSQSYIDELTGALS